MGSAGERRWRPMVLTGVLSGVVVAVACQPFAPAEVPPDAAANDSGSPAEGGQGGAVEAGRDGAGEADAADADAAKADAADAEPVPPKGSVACGSSTCQTPAQACCLVWQEADRCVDGTLATCSVDSGAATELARCDRTSDCAPGFICCGTVDQPPFPFQSRCAAATDCAGSGGREMCQPGGACPVPTHCQQVTNTVYATCQ